MDVSNGLRLSLQTLVLSAQSLVLFSHPLLGQKQVSLQVIQDASLSSSMSSRDDTAVMPALASVVEGGLSLVRPQMGCQHSTHVSKYCTNIQPMEAMQPGFRLAMNKTSKIGLKAVVHYCSLLNSLWVIGIGSAPVKGCTL